ncbi:hypothetical protein GCM10009800_37600 [Nocardiopsis rhodophaea]
MITIRHTRAEGTIAHGTSRHDGTAEHLKAAGFRFSRHLPDGPGWYLRNSRDKSASTWRIDDAARRMRNAGFTVTVHIDNATPGRSFAEAEAERYERAEERSDRAATYGGQATAKATAVRARYEEMFEGWPLGQPLISDRARAFQRGCWPPTTGRAAKRAMLTTGRAGRPQPSGSGRAGRTFRPRCGVSSAWKSGNAAYYATWSETLSTPKRAPPGGRTWPRCATSWPTGGSTWRALKRRGSRCGGPRTFRRATM